MPAYLIVEITRIKDPETYARYRKAVPPTIREYGGEYLARGGEVTVLEGDWNPNRVVVVEFPTAKRAREWYDSELYAPIKPLRTESVDTTMILLDGLTPAEKAQL